MAIYHMQAKVVSRGSDRSAVAASAYMSCSRMYNDYDGMTGCEIEQYDPLPRRLRNMEQRVPLPLLPLSE